MSTGLLNVVHFTMENLFEIDEVHSFGTEYIRYFLLFFSEHTLTMVDHLLYEIFHHTVTFRLGGIKKKMILIDIAMR